MRVAIVGCGLIGRKRARALDVGRVVVAADTVTSRAQALADEHPGCVALADWREAVQRDDVDVVIVATTNDALAPVALAAVSAGKHVLLEKPGARTPEELLPVRDAAQAHRVVVKVGFNHRFHPAFRKAHELFAEGAIGPLLYVRARYGHGGR